MNRRSFASVLVFALFCTASFAADPPKEVRTITAEELRTRLAGEERPLLVDVREQNEWDEAHIEQATLVPLATVVNTLKEMPKEKEILLICRSGRRSGIAYRQLEELGFRNLRNVEGGMLAWEKLGYPVVGKE